MLGYRAISFELAVFCMDYHDGQTSRLYRLLCRLNPHNFSPSFCAEMRDSVVYSELVQKFGKETR